MPNTRIATHCCVPEYSQGYRQVSQFQVHDRIEPPTKCSDRGFEGVQPLLFFKVFGSTDVFFPFSKGLLLGLYLLAKNLLGCQSSVLDHKWCSSGRKFGSMRRVSSGILRLLCFKADLDKQKSLTNFQNALSRRIWAESFYVAFPNLISLALRCLQEESLRLFYPGRKTATVKSN